VERLCGGCIVWAAIAAWGLGRWQHQALCGFEDPGSVVSIGVLVRWEENVWGACDALVQLIQ